MNWRGYIVLLLLLGCTASATYKKVKVRDKVVDIYSEEDKCIYVFEPTNNKRILVKDICGLCAVGDTLIRTKYVVEDK